MSARPSVLLLLAACAEPPSPEPSPQPSLQPSPQPVSQRPAPAPAPPHATVAAYMDRWCMHCHEGEASEGEFDLLPFLEETTARRIPLRLRTTREQIEIGEMPPKDEDQPPPAETEAVLAWLRAAEAAAKSPTSPSPRGR